MNAYAEIKTCIHKIHLNHYNYVLNEFYTIRLESVKHLKPIFYSISAYLDSVKFISLPYF